MRVPFAPQTGACRICGRAVEAQKGEFLCTDCSGAFKPAFDRAASALRFEGVAREMVNGFKFRQELFLVKDFTDWIEAAARIRFDVTAADLVVPMPLPLYRRWDRGYNQTACLARDLARRLDRRCETRMLRRTGHPARQSTLDEEARRENVKGTFAVRRPEYLRGRTVLLVDDILTTGSTLSEAARTLKAAGAARVWALTLARARR